MTFILLSDKHFAKYEAIRDEIIAGNPALSPDAIQQQVNEEIERDIIASYPEMSSDERRDTIDWALRNDINDHTPILSPDELQREVEGNTDLGRQCCYRAIGLSSDMEEQASEVWKPGALEALRDELVPESTHCFN